MVPVGPTRQEKGSEVDLENLLAQKGRPPVAQLVSGLKIRPWHWLPGRLPPSCRQYPLSTGYCSSGQAPCASDGAYLLFRLPQVTLRGMQTLQAAPCCPPPGPTNLWCFQVKSFWLQWCSQFQFSMPFLILELYGFLCVFTSLALLTTYIFHVHCIIKLIEN